MRLAARVGAVLLLAAAAAAPLAAQVDALFAGLTDVQQGLALNPARAQRYRLSIGLPGAALSYYNRSLPTDLLLDEAHLARRFSAAVARLEPGGFISAAGRVDVFGVSAKLPAGHFTLSLSERFQVYSEVPVEGLRFLDGGDAVGLREGVEVRDQRSTGIAYAELALGYQRELDDGALRLGGRLRVLHGQAHGKVIDGDIRTVATDTGTYIRATALLRSAGVAGEEGDDNPDRSPRAVLGGPWNPGLALDFGVVHAPGDGWAFGLSLLDLGFVRFRDQTQDFALDGDLSTPGFANLVAGDASRNVAVDTLAGIFEDIKSDDFTETVTYVDPYTQMLLPRLVADAEYAFTERLAAGIRYGARVWPKRLSHTAAVYGRARAGRWLQATAGYSLRDGVHHLLGAGFELRLGPVQLYASADDLVSLGDLGKLEANVVRAGLNLVLPVDSREDRRRARRGQRGRRGGVRCYKF